MNSRDLLTHPLWRGDELGRAIPDSVHAVSVALPRWQDVVGYEEKKTEVMKRLAGGYPRFVIHPLVARLAATAGAGAAPCLPFPSRRVAEACAVFVRQTPGVGATVRPQPGFHAVVTNDTGAGALKAFWQHTGLIISSRQAMAVLDGKADLAVANKADDMVSILLGNGSPRTRLAPTPSRQKAPATQAVSRHARAASAPFGRGAVAG